MASVGEGPKPDCDLFFDSSVNPLENRASMRFDERQAGRKGSIFGPQRTEGKARRIAEARKDLNTEGRKSNSSARSVPVNRVVRSDRFALQRRGGQAPRTHGSVRLIAKGMEESRQMGGRLPKRSPSHHGRHPRNPRYSAQNEPQFNSDSAGRRRRRPAKAVDRITTKGRRVNKYAAGCMRRSVEVVDPRSANRSRADRCVN
jgi:hypothetical protein